MKLSIAPLCERCQREGRTVLANQVHHLRERANHPDHELDLDNLESLCRACHNQVHAGKGSA